MTLRKRAIVLYTFGHTILARLDEVQEELLYYPRRRRWRRRRRRRRLRRQKV